MISDDIFEKSIIVSAHPDDEALWFSSVVSDVDEVVFCFLDCRSNPAWSEGRKKSLSEYPLPNVSCLEIREAEVFSPVNWNKPKPSKFGVKISSKKIALRYRMNFHRLKKHLGKKLGGFKNVFTHNPWGEYGNEEHVQVFNAVRALQEKQGFNLWYTNYCSNKSIRLLERYTPFMAHDVITLKTNEKISEELKSLYLKNGCWTWYENWKSCEEETFIKYSAAEGAETLYGRTFPLNMINVRFRRPA